MQTTHVHGVSRSADQSAPLLADGDLPHGSNTTVHAKSSTHLRFALVIPALNEEEAIGSTLERALAARRHVIENTPIKEMYVVFVNDGSTDRTQEIVDQFPDVVKIRFEKNRGYGAAIKAGFQATDAELVGFMDADGTCDPRFCVELINNLLQYSSDISVGSRMNAESEMPAVRRLGNMIFAHLIGAVSRQKLTDSASGMRVLRRSSLKHLHPLPDGLHFTPAMTCLALLDPRLKITEVPMPYKERMGQSKLRVIKDGFRFLFIILFTAALFNPIKSLAVLGTLFLLLGLAIGGVASRFGETLPVMMIWSGAFIFVFLQALFVGLLSHQALYMLIGPWRVEGFAAALLQRYFWTTTMVRAGVILFIVGLAGFGIHLFLPHPWNIAVAVFGSLAVVFAGWTALAGVILRVIWAAKQRRIAEHEDRVGASVSVDSRENVPS